MKPTLKKKVFISYAREDKEDAVRVNDFFEQHGIATWFDQLDSMPGALWQEATLTAIRDADYFIALLSETSVAKKDGFVWREFNLALTKQRGFRDNRKFIFPVQLEAVKIPKEFERYHSVRFSDEALIKVLEVIETEELPTILPLEPKPLPALKPPSPKLMVFLMVAGFVLALIIVAFNGLYAAPLIFKTTIRDTAKNPIQDAYAYILGPNDDTIIKSPPSGTNGQVYFELDATDEISATVWYYHPKYLKISKTYTLRAHESHRYVELLPSDTAALLDGSVLLSKPAPTPPKKLFLLTGFDLTAAERQQIKNSTGYSFSYADEAKRISVDYDHMYEESVVKGKFIFRGSAVFLVYDSIRINTGIYFPPDGGVARSKEDIDRDNTAAFNQLLTINRSVIVNALIRCLKDF
jgi:hypothetical protein